MPDEAMGDLVPVNRNTAVAPIEKLRRELAEAVSDKDLPRLQRVIGAATLAAESQQRVARLAERDGSPSEIVEAANTAAVDAAAVKLAAQASAAEIIRLERDSNGRTIAEMMGLDERTPGDKAYKQIEVWRKVADIPEGTRIEYVDKMRETGDLPTTAGLLRYAAPPKPEPEGRDNLEVAYDTVVRHLSEALQYDPKTMASHANLTKRRTQFRKLMDRMRDWVEKTDDIIR